MLPKDLRRTGLYYAQVIMKQKTYQVGLRPISSKSNSVIFTTFIGPTLSLIILSINGQPGQIIKQLDGVILMDLLHLQNSSSVYQTKQGITL